MKRDPQVTRYLNTMKRIPRDIFLDIWMREFNEYHPHRCLCGWAIRDVLANSHRPELLETSDAPFWVGHPSLSEISHLRLAGISNEHTHIGDGRESYIPQLQAHFGGSFDEWDSLFCGAATDTENVEEAVVIRLNQLVRVR